MLCVGALVVVVELPVSLLSAGRRNWPASRRAPVVVIVVLLAFSVDVLPWCAVGGGVGGVGDGVDGVVVVVALLLDALPWCAVGGGVGGVGGGVGDGVVVVVALSADVLPWCGGGVGGGVGDGVAGVGDGVVVALSDDVFGAEPVTGVVTMACAVVVVV